MNNKKYFNKSILEQYNSFKNFFLISFIDYIFFNNISIFINTMNNKYNKYKKLF